MGEGKSTVIVPIVAAELADGLVRIIVTKLQSREMLHSLTAALGGLLGHRIYTLPFPRDFKYGCYGKAEILVCLYEQCRGEGGVLLVARCCGRSSLLTDCSKDIVDESDENFSVRFELTYTMGAQKPVDLARIAGSCPAALEFDVVHPEGFPHIRILDADCAGPRLVNDVAHHICEHGIEGYPHVARQGRGVRAATIHYLTEVVRSPSRSRR
ncbi:hypothetical protein B0T25DRAFT_597097 [Lasiosphaeria hispida]|uniref:DUF3638 domain-containing protein n=1 Tax=Lasiosphaeria hispida TaxID=260671 RepID=A0AAJ0HW01_9PEZI|nr:hypothetical protein B0T25DRAFT_597097 [Lasiosphaeria hispida]